MPVLLWNVMSMFNWQISGEILRNDFEKVKAGGGSMINSVEKPFIKWW